MTCGSLTVCGFFPFPVTPVFQRGSGRNTFRKKEIHDFAFTPAMLLSTMKIEALLIEKHIRLNLDSATKEEVIDTLLAMVGGHDKVRDNKLLAEDVRKREREMSTGIGKNIGLPHAKTSAVTEPVLALATLANEVDFESIDNQPVKIVFLLATPETMLAEHLKLLGRITRLAGRDDVRRKLIEAKTPGEVLALFQQEEKDLPQI
jgi:PTS system fructose-specific IIA component